MDNRAIAQRFAKIHKDYLALTGDFYIMVLIAVTYQAIIDKHGKNDELRLSAEEFLRSDVVSVLASLFGTDTDGLISLFCAES